MVFFALVALLLAEFLSFEKPKGEVLLFRRKYHKKHHKTAFDRALDEECQEARQGRLAVNHHTSEIDTSPTLAQQNSIFHWADVCYDIPIKGQKRTILDHVDGWVKPGALTALMVRSTFYILGYALKLARVQLVLVKLLF